MALSRLDPQANFVNSVAACHDVATNAYGVWPLAINFGARLGFAGAVETFTDWSFPEQLLEQGIPLVCSVRWDKDTLKNAPMPSSQGHLVVLYGLNQDQVLVMDPAAATDDQVPRRYDAQEFSTAWLARRGAAYVFAGLPVRQPS